MSKFSSHCKTSGIVRSIVWRATSLPSTFSTPVPPRPMPLRLLKASVPTPRPSYLKSNSRVCLPGVSASEPSQRARKNAAVQSLQAEAVLEPRNPMVGSLPDCCACAGSDCKGNEFASPYSSPRPAIISYQKRALWQLLRSDARSLTSSVVGHDLSIHHPGQSGNLTTACPSAADLSAHLARRTHSITSSVRASSEAGGSMPRVLAVLRKPCGLEAKPSAQAGFGSCHLARHLRGVTRRRT